MGYCIESTEEMGEYSVEARNESFYLSGENLHSHIYNGAEEPRHVIHFYPTFPHPVNRLDDDTLQMYKRLLSLPSDRVERKAFVGLLDELHRARDFEQSIIRETINAGTVEILIEDIPKIRAALDAVEEYKSKN